MLVRQRAGPGSPRARPRARLLPDCGAPPHTMTAAVPSVSRRSLLHGIAAALATSAPDGRLTRARTQWAGRDPFRVGVAAGEPAPDRFVMWTRLALEPLSP